MMINMSEDIVEKLAEDNLNKNLPFLYEAFQITNPLEQLEELTIKNSEKYGIVISTNTLAIILGIHSPHHYTALQRWDTYTRFCQKIVLSCYIPFIDDEVSKVICDGTSRFVHILKSKVYPSGILVKQIMPKEFVKNIKAKGTTS